MFDLNFCHFFPIYSIFNFEIFGPVYGHFPMTCHLHWCYLLFNSLTFSSFLSPTLTYLVYFTDTFSWPISYSDDILISVTDIYFWPIFSFVICGPICWYFLRAHLIYNIFDTGTLVLSPCKLCSLQETPWKMGAAIFTFWRRMPKVIILALVWR